MTEHTTDSVTDAITPRKVYVIVHYDSFNGCQMSIVKIFINEDKAKEFAKKHDCHIQTWELS